MSFASIAHLFRPIAMASPYDDRDRLAEMGLQPDDKPRQWAVPTREGDRHIAAANEIGEWGVLNVRDNEWAVFPQADWVGEPGRMRAVMASDEENEAED